MSRFPGDQRSNPFGHVSRYPPNQANTMENQDRMPPDIQRLQQPGQLPQHFPPHALGSHFHHPPIQMVPQNLAHVNHQVNQLHPVPQVAQASPPPIAPTPSSSVPPSMYHHYDRQSRYQFHVNQERLQLRPHSQPQFLMQPTSYDQGNFQAQRPPLQLPFRGQRHQANRAYAQPYVHSSSSRQRQMHPHYHHRPPSQESPQFIQEGYHFLPQRHQIGPQGTQSEVGQPLQQQQQLFHNAPGPPLRMSPLTRPQLQVPGQPTGLNTRYLEQLLAPRSLGDHHQHFGRMAQSAPPSARPPPPLMSNFPPVPSPPSAVQQRFSRELLGFNYVTDENGNEVPVIQLNTSEPRNTANVNESATTGNENEQREEARLPAPSPIEEPEPGPAPRLNINTGRMEGGAGICQEIRDEARERFQQNLERMNAIMDGIPMNYRPSVVTNDRHFTLRRQVRLLTHELNRQKLENSQVEQQCQDKLNDFKRSTEEFHKTYDELCRKVPVPSERYEEMVDRYYQEMKAKLIGDTKVAESTDTQDSETEEEPKASTSKAALASMTKNKTEKSGSEVLVQIKQEPLTPSPESSGRNSEVPSLDEEAKIAQAIAEINKNERERCNVIYHSQGSSGEFVQPEEPANTRELSLPLGSMLEPPNLQAIEADARGDMSSSMPAPNPPTEQYYVRQENYTYVPSSVPPVEEAQGYHVNPYQLAEDSMEGAVFAGLVPPSEEIRMSQYNNLNTHSGDQYSITPNSQQQYPNPPLQQPQQFHNPFTQSHSHSTMFMDEPMGSQTQAPHPYNQYNDYLRDASIQHEQPSLLASPALPYDMMPPFDSQPQNHPEIFQRPSEDFDYSSQMLPTGGNDYDPNLMLNPSSAASGRRHRQSLQRPPFEYLTTVEVMAPPRFPPHQFSGQRVPTPMPTLSIHRMRQGDLPEQSSGPRSRHQVQHWVPNPDELLRSHPEIYKRYVIYERMRAAGLDPPFPAEVQHFLTMRNRYPPSSNQRETRSRRRQVVEEEEGRRHQRRGQPHRRQPMAPQEPIVPNIEIPEGFPPHLHHRNSHNVLLCGGGVVEVKPPPAPVAPSVSNAMSQGWLENSIGNENPIRAVEAANAPINIEVENQIQAPLNEQEVEVIDNNGNNDERANEIHVEQVDIQEEDFHPDVEGPAYVHHEEVLNPQGFPEILIEPPHDERGIIDEHMIEMEVNFRGRPPGRGEQNDGAVAGPSYARPGVSKLEMLLVAAERALESHQLESDDQEDDPDALIIDESAVVNDVGVGIQARHDGQVERNLEVLDQENQVENNENINIAMINQVDERKEKQNEQEGGEK